MEKIVFFGKGGSGKSTISTNISYIYAQKGMKVLHVGCDPKKDSSVRLLGGRPETTLMDELFKDHMPANLKSEKIFLKGRLGIDCVESGGPEPGVGCAGRGIILMMEHFEKMRIIEGGRYDVTVFDVLGDLVCGGFAAPLRHGFARKVFIVVSEEFMSLHAANNIAKMVSTYAANGIALGGLVANLRHVEEKGGAIVERFAESIGTRVVARIPHDSMVLDAERKNMTVIEYAEKSPTSKLFYKLADDILDLDVSGAPIPTPMDDSRLDDFFKSAVM